MKRKFKILSLVIAFIMLSGVFCNTAVFASERPYLSFYPTGQRTVKADSQDYFQVISSSTEPPTVKVSDASIVKVDMDKLIGDATLKTYQYRFNGLKAGSAKVTLSSKDGLSVTETFTVTKGDSSVPAFKSDTTGTHTMKEGSSYTFKITSFPQKGSVVKPTVTVSNTKVVKIESVKQAGAYFYCKLTAIGKAGQSAQIYTSASGVKKVTQMTVSIASKERKLTTAEDSKVKCDTFGEFSVQQDGSYIFKLTAKNGVIPEFSLGSGGVFVSAFVKQTGNDYYYKITAIGKPGQSVGVYTAAPDEKPIRQCRVFIREK